MIVGDQVSDMSVAEAARLWAGCGAQALTADGVGVPIRLVRRMVGLARALDARGAALDRLAAPRGLGLLAERSTGRHGGSDAATASVRGASRLVETIDGWIAVTLARESDLASIPAWLDPDLRVSSDDPWPDVERLARSSTSATLVERATLLGLPCSRVGEVSDGRPAIAHRRGDAPPRAVEGAVVVNLASLWAGPLCANVLGRLGARIVTVESIDRPDGARAEPGFFEGLHAGAESVALDFRSESGRSTLARLVRAADIVIEGSRPRALEQLGLVAADVVADGPRIWISITGHGRAPGLRERVGFGDDAAAGGGLVGRLPDGRPAFIADAVADPLTGLTSACAAVELCERGGRWLIDAALSRVARSASGDVVSEARVEPSAPPSVRAEGGGSLPLGAHTDAVVEWLARVGGGARRDDDRRSRSARGSGDVDQVDR